MTPKESKEKDKDIKFEAALTELEGIVTKLESQDLPLEDALTFFEKGIGLSKICTKKLEEAEKKVDALLKELNKSSAGSDDKNAS